MPDEPQSSDNSSSQVKLYAFGSNGSGQLGVGHFEDLSKPQKCKFIERTACNEPANKTDIIANKGSIRKIVAGGNHTLVLFSHGTVYAAGNNIDGRCGIPVKIVDGKSDVSPHFAAVRLPLKIDPHAKESPTEFEYIADVAATWEASFFVCGEDRRRVYACGTGQRGELGLAEGITTMPEPKLVFDLKETDHSSHKNSGNTLASITTISACMNHVVLLTSTGDLFGWGASRKEQLGQDLAAQKIVWKPTRVNIPLKPMQTVTGKDFTICINADNQQLILGKGKDFSTLSHISSFDSSSLICAGWSSILALRDGWLSGSGRNDRGQLPAQDMPRVQAVAAGSEHSVALFKSGSLVAWGWGEHGNCGSPIDAKGNVVGNWNVIEMPSHNSMGPDEMIKGVGAGCATSFCWTDLNS